MASMHITVCQCILFIYSWFLFLNWTNFEIRCIKNIYNILYFIMQRSEELGLFVYDEEDNETILLHRISSDDIYRKQEGNLQLLVRSIYSLSLSLSH